MELTVIDHKEYPKRLKIKSSEELLFIIKDAKAAIEVNPDGHKVGYYQDEINYCAMELRDRKQKAEIKYNKSSASCDKAEAKLAAVMFNMAANTYLAVEKHSKCSIIVPHAIDEQDVINKAGDVYLDVTRGQSRGVWEITNITEPKIINKSRIVI